MWNSRLEFLENSYYHIYNKWLSIEPLFHDDKEFDKFYELLLRYLKEYQDIKLVSYSFLPDHFHIIVKNLKTWHRLSDFMKKLQWAYATSYRKKYPSELKQPVFKWRFKSTRIDSEEYLHKCMSFVNYNPLKHKLVENIKEYKYTSIHRILKTGPKEYLNNKELGLDELEYGD